MSNCKFLFIFITIVITGCGSNDGAAPSPAVSSVCTGATTPEISQCSATIAVGASPITVSGTAQFFKRTVTNQLGRLILGAPITSPLPIKFAEVRVLNSAGTVVQCGSTDAAGALKAVDGSSNLQIPSTVGNYTVEVLSRANHTMDVTGVPTKPGFQIYASVKKDICANVLHSISASITSDGTTASSPSLIAYARESETNSAIQGGAFNIFNDLITTYEYLATNTGTVDISCLSPKLDVFWQPDLIPLNIFILTRTPLP